MNKRIIIAVALLMMFNLPALADPTTADVWWTGGGTLDIDFTAGNDMMAQFDAFGPAHMGEFHGKNFSDNPYSYNVDTATAFVKAALMGGGSGYPDSFMTFQVDRLDSKTSMYGPANQQTYSEIWTDGTAEMAYGTTTNYASMTNGQFGWVYSGSAPYSPTTNGVQFEATGNHYILHQVSADTTNPASNFGTVEAWGFDASTASKIKLMGETAQGSTSFNMGRLGVCGDSTAWDNNYATFSGTGTGRFLFGGVADNQIDVGSSNNPFVPTVPGTPSDPAQFHMDVWYSGSWSWSDYGIKGN